MKSWQLYFLCCCLFIMGFLFAMLIKHKFFSESRLIDSEFDYTNQGNSVSLNQIDENSEAEEALLFIQKSIEKHSPDIDKEELDKMLDNVRQNMPIREHFPDTPKNSEIDKIFNELDTAIEELGLANFEVQDRMAQAFVSDIPEALNSIGTYPKTHVIMDLWQDRKFDEVMDMANKRLEENPNDLPGLLMQLEYTSIQRDPIAWGICAKKIIKVAGQTKTDSIKDKLPLMAFEYSMAGAQLRDIAKQQAPVSSGRKTDDKLPSHIAFEGFMYLSACEKDGLF